MKQYLSQLPEEIEASEFSPQISEKLRDKYAKKERVKVIEHDINPVLENVTINGQEL